MLKKALVGIFTLVLVFALAACSAKTSLTETEFSDSIEEAGYTVVDGTSRFEEDVTAAMQAVDPDEKFTIEFYVFSSSDKASTSFAGIKDHLSKLKGTWNTSNYGAYSTCRGSNNGTYYATTRINDTVIYIETEDTNKDAVEEILKTLGYR